MKRFVEKILGRTDGTETRPAAGYTEPRLPPGRRLYAVGDIHGRLDLLEELHDLIRADAAGFDGDPGIVYLGDFVDRGAQSRQVLDCLIDDPLEGFEAIHLMGNHERAMLDFLDHPESAAAWISFGGQVTLISYGVGLGYVMTGRNVVEIRDELEDRLPEAHRAFLEKCRLSHQEGSYFFVHAGIRPGVPLERQAPEDLMWIRDEFLASRKDHGCIVVHGHSISEEAVLLPNRICIDTGAFHSGLLTAVVLEGGDQRLLQTGRAA